MDLSAVTVTQLAALICIVAMVAAGVAVLITIRKRRTERLRAQFGGSEYTRAVREGGGKRQAEAALDDRAQRVERLHIRPLAATDRARFVESWSQVQARFVDGPGGRVPRPTSFLAM